jgi:hypothetical protein
LGFGIFSSGAESAADRDASAPPVTLDKTRADRLLEVRANEGDREISRSTTRAASPSAQRATKTQHLPVTRQQMTGQVVKTVQTSDPREIARQMLAERGWADQFSCLDSLWVSESNWSHTATNPYSGAYGIPQSLPAEKMATAGPDWRTNPATQIEWGLDYIAASYGSPCSAWSFKSANNWY